MNVLELFNGTIEHYMSKVPRWANLLIVGWILFAGCLYFDLISLPEMNDWLVMLIMLPVLLMLLALFLHMLVTVIQWVIVPVRWVLKKFGAVK